MVSEYSHSPCCSRNRSGDNGGYGYDPSSTDIYLHPRSTEQEKTTAKMPSSMNSARNSSGTSFVTAAKSMLQRAQTKKSKSEDRGKLWRKPMGRNDIEQAMLVAPFVPRLLKERLRVGGKSPQKLSGTTNHICQVKYSERNLCKRFVILHDSSLFHSIVSRDGFSTSTTVALNNALNIHTKLR